MKRSRAQYKRPENFFEANINPKAAKEMSEFCKEAHIIYDLWDNGDGVDDLEDYLVCNVGCNIKDAETICKYYCPESPPKEVCPVETINKGNFNDVFTQLSLQLPSIGIDGNGVWPKNLLAWVLMKKVFGEDSFDFELHGTGKTGDNKITFPRLIFGPDGNPIPFGLAALDAIQIGELPAHAVKKAETLTRNLGQTGVDFAKMLLEADFIFPPAKSIIQVVEVLKRGLNGEKVIVSGAFCPDYAYVESKKPNVKFEYTFDKVGTGIGLVAQQFVRVLPHLVEFFDKYGIKYHVKLAIGDFEANSQEILKSVGVTRDEFINRCLLSLEAFRQEFPDIDMELVLFEQQWANGRWKKYIDEAEQLMKNGDFGKIRTHTGKEPKREIEFIANDSASFYRKWYNRPEMTIKEIIELVIGQGAEYVAMGRVLRDDFEGKPLIQVAGDRPKMQMFNSFNSNHPTLCCKRVY